MGTLALISLWGCASYTDETREIRSLYRSESYRAALTKLEASDLKTEDKNRLLYRLEKAMILDRLQEREKSRALLIQADKIADELYTTSISRTAASFVVNDAVSDYDGEDYEKVAIHTVLALSFLADQNYESARVEAKKINNKLAEINAGYEDKKNRYGEDAFARYLSGMIYEARGEYDDAIIDYKRAIELFRGAYAEFVNGGVPDNLVRAYWRLLELRRRPDAQAQLEKDFPKVTAEAKKAFKQDEGTGEIIVIHEIGHIATKTTQEFIFPFGKQVIRFSFPVIRKRTGSYIGQTGFSVDGGSLVGAENVQDMDAIASATLEDRRLRMVAKQATRLIAKGQLTEQAYKNFGPLGGIAANVFSAVTETADTRSWTLLPEAFFVSRKRVKPGTYKVEVRTGGRLGQIEKVEVRRGKVVILRDVG